jgi:SNF2 family DNA or RNA helicase
MPQAEDPAVLLLRPLGGHQAETVGILPSIEPVDEARFSLPDPDMAGDWISARLLREAARLSSTNTMCAVRCWTRISADPRPYQLVPLLLALKMDTVRLLIADDVGIGKTIEALLIARELWDRGEISRMTVLAPPALVDQWVAEMENKFHLEAVPVLSGTAARLERGLPAGRSLFEEYPVTVVSLDFIKAERRRDEFLRTCPELVIVDEAHSCAAGAGARHLRHQLLAALARDPDRHMILVTATPHSGNQEAFSSLTGLLSSGDGTGPVQGRESGDFLAARFIQRRRPDIRGYLSTTTMFPERLEKEESYQFTDAYRGLFMKVLDYAERSMESAERGSRLHRVRWWAALALLRAIGSSPKAAEATLLTRAGPRTRQTREGQRDRGADGPRPRCP